MRAGSFAHCNPVPRTVLGTQMVTLGTQMVTLGTQMVTLEHLLKEKNVLGLHSALSPVRLQSSSSYSMFFQNELWLEIRL